MRNLDLILASTSPKRRALLNKLGLPHQCVAPDFKELNESLCPSILPLLNAEGKGRSVSKFYPKSWVLSADTIIEHRGKIIGKPSSIEEAGEILASFSGNSHNVITAVLIAQEASKTFCIFTDSSQVFFKTFGHTVIEEYMSKVNPMNKAGAYSIDEYDKMLIDEVRGSRTNVAGLPVEKMFKAFVSLGLNLEKANDFLSTK